MTTRNQMERRDREVYDFNIRYAGDAPPQTGADTPVFDRAVRGPVVSELPLAIPFHRTDRDRRPGRPLPPEMTGDPAPDRLERAEALRQLLAAKDARHRIEGSVDREPIYKDARVNGRGKAHAASTPDIERPRATYVPVPPELAKFEARRDDQVLFFATASAAARCITGENLPKWTKAVQNVASGNTRKAFGWDFIRLQSNAPRRGARRKAIR